MNKEEQIRYEAEYIIHGNRNIEESALALSKVLGKNISKRTLQLHMNKRLKEIDYKKYQEVREAIDKTAKKKMSKGGMISKRETKYSKTLILLIASEMIATYNNGHKLTLELASKKYNIPVSTLCQLLKNKNIISEEEQKKLNIVKNYNKKAR